MLYADLTSPEIAKVVRKAIAVLPIAAVEQHGRHLPVITDTALVSEIAQRMEKALPQKVALLPTFWAGCSHHHLGFPGTLSISSETYIRVLEDLVDCLIQTGFRRIVLFNGHGGNIIPANEALYRLNLKYCKKQPLWIAAATYWQVASRELAHQKFMETPALSHACEYETSMMMALRVDWVKMGLRKGGKTFRGSKFYDPLGYAPSRVSVCETFDQMTITGAMGSPEKATVGKGKKLFALISEAFIEFIQDFSRWEKPKAY